MSREVTSTPYFDKGSVLSWFMTHKVVYRSTGSTLTNFPGLAVFMLEANETESYAAMSDRVKFYTASVSQFPVKNWQLPLQGW